MINPVKVRAVFKNNSWGFEPMFNPGNRVPFDQALIDATRIAPGVVEGFVRSSHGISFEHTQYMDARTRESLGITSAHRLGRGVYSWNVQRVQLLQNGKVVKVEYQ